MPESATRFDKSLRWLKNHPVWSVFIVLGVIIIALGTLTTALSTIFGAFRTSPSLQVADVRVIDKAPEIDRFRRAWLPAETTVTVWDSLRYEVDDAESKRTAQGIIVIPSGRRRTQTQPVRGALGAFPFIDVLLRNPTSEAAVVTSVKVAARRVTVDQMIGFCSPMVPTWAYHLLLQSDSSSQLVTAPLAQQVPANGADRFVLVLGHEGSVAEATYDVAIDLVYDRSKVLSLGQHHVRIGSLCGAGPRLTVPFHLRTP
jgi:hypothetical protein